MPIPLKDSVTNNSFTELDFLSKTKRNVYEDIFSMIYEYTSNTDVAKRLVKKIVRKTRKEHGQL